MDTCHLYYCSELNLLYLFDDQCIAQHLLFNHIDLEMRGIADC